MKKPLYVLMVMVLMAGCGGTGNKVLQDFGIQDRPDDYVSGSDKVVARLNDVGKSELKRLNLLDRRGEILYDNSDALRGKYYKQLKVYERFYPIEANSTGRTAGNDERGYVGYIEYVYQMYEGPRKNTRAEAMAELADIPTGDDGRETYRYRFNSAGTWSGGKGEKVR